MKDCAEPVSDVVRRRFHQPTLQQGCFNISKLLVGRNKGELCLRHKADAAPIALRNFASPSPGSPAPVIDKSSRREQVPHLGIGEHELRKRTLVIEINRQDTPSVLRHRNCQICGDCRLTDTSLEVQ